MYKLGFYVPQTHLAAVKRACFDAGAGRSRGYEHCCWQVKGQSQFRPLPGSDPFIGASRTLEQVTEYRVEMVCDDTAIGPAVNALIAAHPYEEPAWDLVALITEVP